MNPFELPPADFYDARKEEDRLAILPDYLRIALVENHEPLVKAWQAVIRKGTPLEPGASLLVQPLLSEEEMARLGREVWTPGIALEGATPEERAEAQRKEEARQRRKSDLETGWSDQLRQRYEKISHLASGVPQTAD
jgi:hypothetical protein